MSNDDDDDDGGGGDDDDDGGGGDDAGYGVGVTGDVVSPGVYDEVDLGQHGMQQHPQPLPHPYGWSAWMGLPALGRM